MNAQALKTQFQANIKPLSHFQQYKHTPLVHTVFNKQSLNLIFAEAGGMKSLLCFDLAIALSTGQEFLGFKTEQSKVLYLDAEMSNSDIGERVNLFNASGLTNIDYLTNGDISFNFKDIEQQEAFTELIKETDYDVIIFDNLRTMTLIENENDSASFSLINQFLIRLRDLNKTIFLVHHANKGAETYAGSSNIITPYDTVIGLVDAGRQGYRKIQVNKNRSSSSGLNSLQDAFISLCTESHRIALNASEAVSEADIAQLLIEALNTYSLSSVVEIRQFLREQGLSFNSSSMNLSKVLKFIEDYAETQHVYKNTDSIKASLAESKKRKDIFSDLPED